MKKERVKTEKDSKLLENKLKMLQTEELRAFKKFSKEKKFKEEWEAARQRTLDFKNELNHNKFQKKQETYQNSIKIKEMRESIQKSLNDKKMMKFQENRLNNLQLKQKKIVIYVVNFRKMRNSKSFYLKKKQRRTRTQLNQLKIKKNKLVTKRNKLR